MWVSLNLACLWCGAIELALFIILHVGRVYFTGGFKKPREVTWISGLVLAVIVKQCLRKRKFDKEKEIKTCTLS